jgi:hypothetical protein
VQHGNSHGDGQASPGGRIAFGDLPLAASRDTIAAMEAEIMPAFGEQIAV